jgi:hypothetical protein
VPTKTQVLHANPQQVLDLLDGWKQTVANLEQHTQTYTGYVERPGGTYWEGHTAEAAQARARQDYQAVARLRDTVDAGAQQVANAVSSELMPPLNNAKHIIANAEQVPGVTVNEDLSITYNPPDGTSDKTAEANKEAIADAAKELADAANAWWAAEQAVAQQIKDLEGNVGKQLNFGAALYDIDQAFPTPPRAPGAPRTLSDMLLPAGPAGAAGPLAAAADGAAGEHGTTFIPTKADAAIGAEGAIAGLTADGVRQTTLKAIEAVPGTGAGQADPWLLKWFEEPTVGGRTLTGFTRVGGVAGAAAAVPAVMSDIHEGNSVPEAVTREAVGTGAGLWAGGLVGGFLADSAAGAAIGSVVPGAGTAVGLVAGAVVGAGAAFLGSKVVESAWNPVADTVSSAAHSVESVFGFG